MFIPGEAFFNAALTQDPESIEYGADRRVIPASPTTLIALLKAVAYGWRQEALEHNAKEVAALGKELYERIQSLAGHWATVGKRLDQAVGAYNTSVNVLETRVLKSTRRFQELRAVPDHRDIDNVAPVERNVRNLATPETTGADNA
ncbi:MAG: DNA recombination protein RmuC [Gammaproteobacteria bacterium]|nr:DNA recombination protein RmuC [Gammaproteobacteria bacterium]